MATDYEKKYKEALERAKKFEDKYGGDYAGYIFPELAESEDERIRKYLIEELKATKSVGELKFIIPQPTREECIAYLEKQAEQKQEKFPPYVTGFKGHPDPAGTSDLEEAAARYERENRQSILSSVDIVDAFIAGAEWQKEQKPAEWMAKQMSKMTTNQVI